MAFNHGRLPTSKKKSADASANDNYWNRCHSRLHRFWVGQVGIGFLYLLTWRLLLFCTITDIVKYIELAFNYNRQIARRIASNLTGRQGTALNQGGCC
jgi:hypothetical protein